MAEQSEPRCPLCGEVMTMLSFEHSSEWPFQLVCNNSLSCGGITVRGETKSECINKALDMKLVADTVRCEEREADCKVIRDNCRACDDGHSGERDADGRSIECMYCGIPIRNIRDRIQEPNDG